MLEGYYVSNDCGRSLRRRKLTPLGGHIAGVVATLAGPSRAQLRLPLPAAVSVVLDLRRLGR